METEFDLHRLDPKLQVYIEYNCNEKTKEIWNGWKKSLEKGNLFEIKPQTQRVIPQTDGGLEKMNHLNESDDEDDEGDLTSVIHELNELRNRLSPLKTCGYDVYLQTEIHGAELDLERIIGKFEYVRKRVQITPLQLEPSLQSSVVETKKAKLGDFQFPDSGTFEQQNGLDMVENIETISFHDMNCEGSFECDIDD